MDPVMSPEAIEWLAGPEDQLRQDWLRLLGTPAPAVFRGSFLRYALSFEVERAGLLSRDQACAGWTALDQPEAHA
jgi:hypothetical protein